MRMFWSTSWSTFWNPFKRNRTLDGMIGISASLRLACVAGGPLLAATISPAYLHADTLHPITPDLNLILPDTWSVVDNGAEEVSIQELSRARLILAAAPADPSRKATLSVIRSEHSLGNATQEGEHMGERERRREIDQFLTLILAQGFRPAGFSSEVLQGETRQIYLFEITAKNAAGQYRQFLSLVPDGPQPVIHLYASREVSDTQAAAELRAIAQSLGSAEKKAGSLAALGQNLPSGPSSNRSSNPHGSIRVGPINSPSTAGNPPSAPYSPSNSPGSRGGNQPLPTMDSPEISQLIHQHQAALLMVEGSKTVGSGFLGVVEGKVCALTNTHVLAGNPTFRLTTLANRVITPSSCALAVGRDVACFEIAPSESGFEIMDQFDQQVRIGDVVAVPGNSEGARVVKVDIGRVVGIGPDRIEIDAPFVPGSSGSPIVHLASGKVIGIATYLTERARNNRDAHGETYEAQSAQAQTIIRRFGYRVDLISQWEPVNWQRFAAQASQVEKIELVSDDFAALLREANSKSGFNALSYSTPELRRPVEQFVSTMSSSRGRSMSLTDRKTEARRFIGTLRAAARSDIQRFDSRSAYDYFRRRVEEHNEFRSQIYEGLTRAMQSQMN